MVQFCLYEGTMYRVEYVIRLDKKLPFKPFVYLGMCDVGMVAQGCSIGAIYRIENPEIMSHEEAVNNYPEYFI